MEIKVMFDDGKFSISPDPAIVQRGELVNWSFRATAIAPLGLHWVIYFSKGSPFRGEDAQFITDTPNVDGQYIGTSRSMSADDPGDYKYGVRVIDSVNQQTLGDDDPWLIVK